jgi:hypothetical protein
MVPVGDFPEPVSGALGIRAGLGDLIGVFLLLPGMLLCVGCPVAGAYPQDFDSPCDLIPV